MSPDGDHDASAHKLATSLAALAALMGAAGVALAAAAAHAASAPQLQTAATFLILHAAAALALTAHAREPAIRRSLLAATAALIFGTLLFSGDISCRVFFETRLFPFAAPLGGSTMILSWIAAAVCLSLKIRQH